MLQNPQTVPLFCQEEYNHGDNHSSESQKLALSLLLIEGGEASLVAECANNKTTCFVLVLGYTSIRRPVLSQVSN